MSEFQECGGRGPARTAQQPWNEKDFKHSEYLYALLSTAFSLHYTLPLDTTVYCDAGLSNVQDELSTGKHIISLLGLSIQAIQTKFRAKIQAKIWAKIWAEIWVEIRAEIGA